jgi:hypothetical protein
LLRDKPSWPLAVFVEFGALLQPVDPVQELMLAGADGPIEPAEDPLGDPLDEKIVKDLVVSALPGQLHSLGLRRLRKAGLALELAADVVIEAAILLGHPEESALIEALRLVVRTVWHNKVGYAKSSMISE